MISNPPTSTEIEDAWCGVVREIQLREKWDMRAHPTMPAIEFKRHNSSVYYVKHLPAGGFLFASAAERDLMLQRITTAPAP